jgi:hypothetical protein
MYNYLAPFQFLSMEQDPLHLLIKKEHSCLFTFLWNVKRQLCPYFITKWREMERIQIPTSYHLSNLLAYKPFL